MSRRQRGRHIARQTGIRRLLSDPAFAPNAALLAGIAAGGWAVYGIAVLVGVR